MSPQTSNQSDHSDRHAHLRSLVNHAIEQVERGEVTTLRNEQELTEFIRQIGREVDAELNCP